MPKRPPAAPWQLEKQRTAKAIRELPKCETKGCTNTGMGVIADPAAESKFKLLWVCPHHAAVAQRAQRERT